MDDCGECLDPMDIAFNQSCIDCAGIPNGTFEIDNCGDCLDKDDPKFNVSCSKDIFIANIFTPNGDGINDLFVLYKRPEVRAEILEYSIYSRWGEQIYHASNFNFDEQDNWWNGEFKGFKLNSGIYVYYIEIVFSDDEIKRYKGTIAIFN